MQKPWHDRTVILPGRGSVVVREWSGPDGAPVLVLLHGVAMDVDINWSLAAPALATRYRVLALDLRGHGQGLPVAGSFRLEDCADDVAAVLLTLGTGPVIPVGFSIGGMVAQLLWRRHRDLVAGLVLSSTARNVTGSPLERVLALAMPWAVVTASWLAPVHPRWHRRHRGPPARRQPRPRTAPRRARPHAPRAAGHRARRHARRVRLQLTPVDRRGRRADRRGHHPARPHRRTTAAAQAGRRRAGSGGRGDRR